MKKKQQNEQGLTDTELKVCQMLMLKPANYLNMKKYLADPINANAQDSRLSFRAWVENNSQEHKPQESFPAQAETADQGIQFLTLGLSDLELKVAEMLMLTPEEYLHGKNYLADPANINPETGQVCFDIWGLDKTRERKHSPQVPKEQKSNFLDRMAIYDLIRHKKKGG